MLLIPDIYKKTVFDIPYKKLKEQGIKCLAFDLDNTLALITEHRVPKDIIKLINKISKDFKVVILTNNNEKRIKPYQDELGIDSICHAWKPFTKGLKKTAKKYKLKKSEMAIIGDQLMTDIKAGKRYGIITILVDPLGKKDLKITYFNRFFERIHLKRYEKRGLFKKGNYYG